jgi:uncharacterized membrane protein YdjX (TVP38/TMEM64 family)
VALLALGALLLWNAPLGLWFKHVHRFVEHLGWAGPGAFVLICIVGTVLCVPGVVLSVAGGLLFGLWGIAAVSVGCTAGATVAFLIARYLARARLARVAANSRTFLAIDEAVRGHGGMLVTLLRLSPMIPFNISNYLYGLTDVKFWEYVVGTWVGTLPVICMEVYLGVAGQVGLRGHHRAHATATYVSYGIGLAATIAVTIVVTYIARKALNKNNIGKNSNAPSESELPR